MIVKLTCPIVLRERAPWKRRPHVTGGKLGELPVRPQESDDIVVASDADFKCVFVGDVNECAREHCDGEDGVELTKGKA